MNKENNNNKTLELSQTTAKYGPISLVRPRPSHMCNAYVLSFNFAVPTRRVT